MVPSVTNFQRATCLRIPLSSTGEVKCTDVHAREWLYSLCIRIRRKKGQGTQSEVKRRDMKRELEERERRAAKERKSKSSGWYHLHIIMLQVNNSRLHLSPQ